MTCPYCESLAPVTRTKLATREKNLTIGGEISTCPKCGTRDWATNTARIMPAEIPIRRTPLLAACVLILGGALCAVGFATYLALYPLIK